MSGEKNVCHGSEIKTRVYKKASSDLLTFLEQYGGSVASKRFEHVVSYCDVPRDILLPLDIAEIFNDLSENESQKLYKIERAYYLDWCCKTVCVPFFETWFKCK